MTLKKNVESGYWQVENPASSEELKSLYASQFYEKEKPEYLEKNLDELQYWESIWGLRLSLMENVLADFFQAPMRILDIGASGGFFLHCAKNKGWKIKGIEPSKSAVAFAKQHFDIELFQGRFEDFLDKNEKYNAIHLSFVLEHVKNPEDFMSLILSLISDNGVIWIEVPNDFNALQYAITSQLEKPQWWVVPQHHLNYFNFDTLSRLMNRFALKEIDRMGTFPVEIFALMGMDYIGNNDMGHRIHGMKMKFEQHVINYDKSVLLNLYRKLAELGLGRSCNILLRKQ